jgi:Carboxypeptidase regulatory-like domain
VGREDAAVHKVSFVGIMLKAGMAILVLPFGLCAPAVMGTLHGRITDGSGVPLAKVLIAVISAQGRVKLGTSDARGQYAIHDLDPGTYTLWAEQESLSVLERAHLGIRRGQVEPIDIKLSASRQPPQFAPASRNSRMDLAGLELGNGKYGPGRRDICR